MDIKDFMRKWKKAKKKGSKLLEKKLFQSFFGQHITCLEDLRLEYEALSDEEKAEINWLAEKLKWHPYIVAGVYFRGKYAEKRFGKVKIFREKVAQIVKKLKKRLENEE